MKFEKVEVNSERWKDLKLLLNEEFRPIEKYENLYEISNYGRIKSLGIYHGKTNNYFYKPHIIKSNKTREGYLIVCLTNYGDRKYFSIHRLVAIAFINNPNNYKEVNHKDSNRTNNMVTNLEWCTRSYNCKYSYSHNNRKHIDVHLKGENNPNSRFTNNDIKDMIKLRNKGLKFREIAEKYNTTADYVSQIYNKKIWKHIDIN